MYEQVEKPKENKSRAVANSVGQKKSNGKQGVGFVDNRPKEKLVIRHLISSSKVAQGYFTYNRSPLTDPQKLSIRNWLNANGNDGNAFYTKAQSTTDNGGISTYLKALGVHQSVASILAGAGGTTEESDDDSASNYSSDIGEYSQKVAEDAATKAAGAKSGVAGQPVRNEQMARLRHQRGGEALSHAATVAVGERTAGQSTFVQGTDDQGALHYAATSSSAPFAKWAGQQPFIVRNEFGDGSHIHGEAGLIYNAIQQKNNLEHVAVNKPICPVCAAVLTAYNISFNPSNVRTEFPSTWGNPFDKREDSVNWTKVNNAATAAVNAAGASTRILS